MRMDTGHYSTATHGPLTGNEVPVGGRPMSPRRPPATITEEPGIHTGQNTSAPVDPPQPVTYHNATSVLKVQLGSRPPGFPPATQERVHRFEMDAETLEDLDFPQRLAVLGGPSLFGRDRFYGIELATLQRMVIHDLQHRLVRLVAHIHNNQYADEGAMDTARRLLDEYCKMYSLLSGLEASKQSGGCVLWILTGD